MLSKTRYVVRLLSDRVCLVAAAVGMVVQQALATKNMNDVCENKYVRMAYSAGSFHPDLQRLTNLLGCNGPNRKFGGSTVPGNKFSTTAGYGGGNDNDNDNDETNQEDNDQGEGGALESGFTPEKQSRFKQVVSITRGEKGAKRNLIRNLFGMKKKDKTFKSGQKLPSSSYKLDKDDASALKDLEGELDEFNKGIH